MSDVSRFARVCASALVVLAVLTGCAAVPSVTGLTGGISSPAPEATVTPAPGSWDEVAVPSGLDLVAITTGESAPIERALDAWAGEHQARVEIVRATDADGVEAALVAAVGADVVVGLGPGVVDAFALSTPQFLDQQFAVVGAQLAEPTENVTAVVWEGASFRGTGISEDGSADGTVSAARAGDAVSAALAAVAAGVRGVVLQLPQGAGDVAP